MMTKRIALFAACAALSFASARHAHAQVLTSDIPTQTNTDLGYLEAAKSYIQQGEQYTMQGEQYYMQGEQYYQQIKNAKGLSILQALTGVNLDGHITADQAIMGLNNAYNSLDPYSGGYLTQAREVISDSYFLPTTGTSAQSQVGTLLGGSSSGPSSLGYDRANRDTNQFMQYSNAIAAVNQERASTAQMMQGQDDASNELGDDDTAQATQLLVAQSSTQMHQNDMNIRLQQVIADNQVQEKLERLETENAIADKNLKHLQKVQAFAASGD